jgi:hypothetical protein
MKKRLLLLASAALFSTAVFAQAVTGSTPKVALTSVAAAVTPTIVPAEGVVEEAGTFTVTFPGVSEISVSITQTADPTLTHPNGVSNYMPYQVTASGNTLTLKLNSSYTEIGSYTLTIPGGCYTLDGEAGQDLTFNYTIGASDKTLEYTVSPEADEEGNVSTISPIVVTFTNAAKVEENTKATGNAFVERYNSKARATWEELPAEVQIQGNTLLFFLEENDQNEGEFRLTIPAGTYLVDGVENTEIVETFNYVKPVQDYVTVNPASGEVEGLQSFTLTFNNATEVATAFTREAYPTLYNASEGHNEFSWQNATVDGNKLTLTANAAITVAGEYELRVPGAAYTVDGEAGQDITVAYTIVASDKTLEYTVSPEADEEGNVSTISPIVVTFTNAAKVEENTKATGNAFVERYNSKARATWEELPAEVQIQGNTLLFFLEENDQNEGEFRLTIPAGTYLVDGVENTEIVETFNYVKPVQDYVTVNPASGEVEGLQSFTLTFNNATEVATAFTREAYPTLYNASEGHNEFSWQNATVDGNKLTLTANAAITVAGEYELRVPGAAYTVDGEAGQDITVAYTIVASDKTLEYTVSPEADEEGNVSTISPIVVTFTNAANVEDNPDADYWTYAFVETNSPLAGWNEIPAEVQIQGNTLLFFLDDQDKNEGEFRLTIPAGTYLVDGVENTEIVKTFNYVAPVQDYATVYPTAGSEVEELSTFTITFPNATEVASVATEWVAPSLYFVSGEYNVETVDVQNIAAEGNTLTITLAQATNVLGDYELRIPGESYTVDGEAGQDLTFSYTIVKPVAESIEPENNAEVETLESFTIKFNYVNETLATAFSREASPSLYSSATGSSTAITSANIEGDLMTFKLLAPISYIGEYTLSIPGASYTVDGVYGTDVEFTYKVVASAKTQEYTIAPEGDTVHTISPIVVTFPNVLKVEANADATDYAKVETEGRMGFDEIPVEIETKNSQILFTLEEADIQNGRYALTIPAGTFLLDGVLNEEIKDTLTLEILVPNYTLTVTPTTFATISQIDTVTVTVGEVDDVDFLIEGQYFTLIGNDEVYFATASAEGATLTLVFDEAITAAGEYNLYIPAEVIKVNGVKVPEVLTLTFNVDGTLSGINRILNDAAGSKTIYNLQGVKVDAKALTPGLYIINGKKVQLR